MVHSGNQMIIVWNDRRSQTNWDIYAQAIDLSGKIVWAEDGVPVCTHPAGQSPPVILSDGEGGVLVAWEDERNSAEHQDLYIQRIDASGNPVWEIDGIPIFPSDAFQSNSQLISDEAGGFYIVWWDVIGYEQWHIMAHRLDRNGKPLWKAPILVSPPEGMQGEPRVVGDGEGGIVVVWQIYDNFINDELYAQRINRDGKKHWDESGVPLCTVPGIQNHASIVNDGNGGILAVWRDERDVYSDLYAQRIGADGKLQWAVNGIPICVAAGHQDAPFLIKTEERPPRLSEEDEFFVAWLDYREDYGDKGSDAIYGQKINRDGKPLWEKDGIPICTADGEQYPPYLVLSEFGELTIVWSDGRSDMGDIYMYRVK
jgi:predicted lipoprotein with Yx(FWY)xxD motif